MQELIVNHFGELVVGIVLMVFGVAFRSWSNAVSHSTGKIINELKSLSREFQQHRIEVERRVTRIETKVNEMDRNHDR